VTDTVLHLSRQQFIYSHLSSLGLPGPVWTTVNETESEINGIFYIFVDKSSKSNHL